MRPVRDLLSRLKAKGVQLRVEGDQLRFRAPEGALDAALKAELVAHKQAVIAFLSDSLQAKPAGLRLVVAPNQAEAPLSYAQQRLWFLDSLGGADSAYNLPTALHMRGPLDPSALETAVAAMVARHSSLRTAFVDGPDGPLQRVSASNVIPLNLLDVPGLDLTWATELGQREQAMPFDLSQRQLLRLNLVRLSPSEHVLLATMHHIISDGWSMAIFSAELKAHYEAALQGQVAALKPLAFQYSDYSYSQRRFLDEGALERQLAWWRKALADAPPRLDLRVDRERPKQPAYQGESLAVQLDATTSAQLDQLSRASGATLFMTLLAGYKLLLSRYADQADVLVATPIANRTVPELEPLIGFFVNTLVLRSQVDERESFTELVAKVVRFTLAAYSHQDLPFELLVNALNPDRTLGLNPLAQVLLVLQNTGPAAGPNAMRLPGLQVRPLGQGPKSALFDLTLELQESASGLHGNLTYNRDIFRPETMRRLRDQLQFLYKSLAANPKLPLRQVSFLDEAERAYLLHDWQNEAPPQETQTIQALFRQQVARTPDQIALELHQADAIRRFSYAELEDEALALAQTLRRAGVRPGDFVVILASDEALQTRAIFAVLFAGAAYVPLDASLPAERLAFFREDSGASVLLVEPSLAPKLSAACVIELVEAAPKNAALTLLDPLPQVSPELPIYMIFTSGSTGKPKGVVLSHAVVVPIIRWAQRFNVPNGRSLRTLSYAFDFGAYETFVALISGTTLVTSDPERKGDGPYFRNFLRTFRIDNLRLTPSFAREMLKPSDPVPGVRWIELGGEACSPDLVEQLYAATGPETRIVNGYGPTEAAITSTFIDLGLAADFAALDLSLIPIGRGCGQDHYIINRQGHLAAYGLPGELYLGLLLAQGYHRRPGLTALSFVPHPYSAVPGARLYRTGDLVRLLADGNIHFEGRIDHQVKLRGFRLELGEIEAVIRQVEGADDAAVLLNHTAAGEPYLAAYLQSASQEPNLFQRVSAFLGERLPAYMVPAAYLRLELLPQTANGKLDHHSLRALGELDHAFDSAFEAPRNEVEQQLAAIWAEILERELIGIHDNFFALGGHSLMATRVASRIRASLGVEMPLVRLFEAPTVAALSDWLTPLLSRTQTTLAVIPALPRDGRPLPLSFAQKRLYFLASLQENAATYNMPMALWLNGGFSLAALAAALDAVSAHHEILRTTFVIRADEPCQVIAEPGPHPLDLVSLEGLADADGEALAHTLWQREATTGFDLARGTLLRLRLLRLAPERHLLLLTQHHIISDAWSLDLLVRQLMTTYATALAGQVPQLGQAPLQYADYAAWQTDQVSQFQEQSAWWKQYLADSPELLDLPTRGPRPAVPTFRGAILPFQVAAPLAEELRQLAQANDCTLFMLMLAAWQWLLARYSGQDDVLVGCPVAGRQRAELEGLLGIFVNTLVLRTRFWPGLTGSQLLAGVRHDTLAALAHQDLPFEQVVEAVAPQRHLAFAPIFQVLFAWQSAGSKQEPVRTTGLTLQVLSAPQETARLDLSLSLEERGQGFSGTLEYATDLFESAMLAGLLRHYERLLAALAENPTVRLDRVELLDASEKAALLQAGAASGQVPNQGLLHEWVGRHAHERPESVALEDVVGQCLTYTQLHQQASTLETLIRQRSQLGDVVAMVLPTSTELVIVWQAVLQAGRTLLPLDPTWPDQRLAHLMEVAGARLLLTMVRGPIAGTQAGFLDLNQLPEAGPTQAPIAVLPDLPAYMIFTSGSTGTPKAVVVSHAAIAHFITWQKYMLGIEPGDRTSLVFSPSFDGSIMDLWPTLCAGATLVIPKAEARSDAALLQAEILERRLTHCGATTALGMLLMQMAWPHRCGLRILLVGGEKLTATAPSALPFTVLNMYGPTETAVAVCAWPVGPSEPILLGPARDGLAIHLLDRDLNPVPACCAGEICIAGPALAQGYHRQPALTAAVFIPNPFAGRETSGSRIYRSGDQATRMGQGFRFIGRRDHQIKLRGFRIELGEIEAALHRHERVEQAVCLVRQQGVSGQLVAYLVVAPDGPDAAELLTFLGQRLPSFMLPTRFVFLEELPLTSAFKIDRKALHALVLETETVAPANPTESLLVQIWAEVLGLETVGVTDNFFELGGHSLWVTKVLARISQSRKVELHPRSLFEAPTIRELALLVDAAAPGITRAALKPRPVGLDLAPLSFGQRRLWILDQLGQTQSYHMPFCLELEGPLDVAAMTRAFDGLCQRHEILRTSLERFEELAQQRIHAAAWVERAFVDCSQLADPRLVAQQLVDLWAWSPFQLLGGRLTRFLIVRLSHDRHLLLLNQHHIVSDGWSLNLLTQELSSAYRQILAGKLDPQPSLVLHYADYALWQTQDQSRELEAQERYWKERLEGAPARLLLPTDRPHGKTSGGPGGRLPLRFSPDQALGLKALAQTHKVSLFMVVQALYALLLSRYSGQDEVCLGTPIAGRSRRELEPILGLFTNTLVLRVDLRSQNFPKLLAQVQQHTLDAFANQDLPFERVVDLLQPERVLGQTPLFQVMISLQNLDSKPLNLPGLIFKPAPAGASFIKFDMVLTFNESGEDLIAVLEYDRNLYDASTAARFGQHLQQLCASVLADPETDLQRLVLLGPDERALLLDQACSEVPALPGLLPELLWLAARDHRESVALECEGQRWTYAELFDRASALALQLQGRGIGPESIVAVLAGRGPELVLGLLATLLSGAAFMPLDLATPQERLVLMLRDSGAALLLCERDRCDGWDLPVICLQDPPEQGSAEFNLPQLESCHAAYVIYTSGSTGQPKGVLIDQGSLTRYMLWAVEAYRLREGAGSAVHGSPAFDATATGIWPVLLCGQALRLLPGSDPGQNLLAALEAPYALTKLSPSHLAMLPELLADGSARVNSRGLVVGGEALSASSAAWCLEHLPAARLYNQYGPTETTVACAMFPVEALDPDWQTVPIGQAMAGAALYVLDRQLELTPLGVVGMLYIGGSNLARGYLGQPGRTAEVFGPSPFGPAGARLYRSGDLVRRLASGPLTFVARADRQLKLRGYRIEPGEIEACLNRAPGVAQAAVLLVNQPVARLLAYVVAAQGVSLENESLRAHLAEHLPAYMVPEQVLILESFPLTRNGKLDTRALPLPESLGRTSEAPVGPEETLLAEIWSELLGATAFGRHDRFYQIGGDSISAIQLVSRARRRGYQLELQDVFKYQSLAELAPRLRASESTVDQGRVFGQAQLLPIQADFFAQNDPAGYHYNLGTLLDLPADLCPETLARAVTLVMSHHDGLSAVFETQADGTWTMVLGGAAIPTLETVDFSELDSAERATAIQAHTSAAQGSFDLRQGPLARCVLYLAPSGQAKQLLLTFHHLLVDAVSLRFVLEDLQEAYAALAAGAPPQLPVKTTSLVETGARLAAYALSPALAAEAQRWCDALSGPVQPLPIEGDGDRRSGAVQAVTKGLDTETTRLLLGPAQAAYATEINELLLAALCAALCQWQGGTSLLLDMEGHGRDLVLEGLDLSRTTGWFTARYPLRLDLPEGDLETLVVGIKEQLRGFALKGSDYGILAQLSTPEVRAKMAQLPRPELTFNYLGRIDTVLSATGGWSASRLSQGPLHHPQLRRTSLLDISAAVVDGKLQTSWAYSPGLHSRAEITRLAQLFIDQLAAIVAHTSQPGIGRRTPSDFPLAGLDETRLAHLNRLYGPAQDVYPLSPLQQGLLFHGLAAPGEGFYINQLIYQLQGLNLDAFKAAWSYLIERHAILRTAFDGIVGSAPLQVVLERASLPFDLADWTNLDENAQRRALAELQTRDRARDYDFGQAPLMRLYLRQTGPTDYLFCWSHHHALLDGWSVPLLMADLTTAYAALSQARQPELAAPPPFRDYLVWLKQRNRQAAQSFWREYLAEPVAASMPLVGQPRGPVQPARVQHRCDSAFSLRVRDRARTLGITLSTLLQGAWAILLGQRCASTQVCFGATVSGRPVDLAQVESILGPFFNTLPVRVALRPETEVRAWLLALQEDYLDRDRFAHLPLREIQALTNQAGAPLFETLFVFENYPAVELESQAEAGGPVNGGGLRGALIGAHEQVNDPLALVASMEEVLELSLLYHANRFEPAAVDRLLQQLADVLAGLCGPQTTLGELDLLGPQTRAQLQTWSQGEREPLGGLWVHEQIQAHARQFPDAPALERDGVVLSYAALESAANGLAWQLIEAGAGPERRIALLLPRGETAVIAMLAVLKSGAAYVPIDPDYPADRIAFLLEDAQPQLVVVDPSLRQLVQANPVQQIVYETRAADVAPQLDLAAADLTYMIYTSGSSGRPKGVMVHHQGLANFVARQIEFAPLRPGERVLQFLSLAFDGGNGFVLDTLCARGTVCFVEREELLADRGGVDLLRRLKITYAHIFASMLASLDPLDLPDLAGLAVGGDACSAEVVARWSRGRRFLNFYGPTEASVVATRTVLEPSLIGPPHIGRPVTNVSAHVVDASARQVGLGCPGELWLGGINLARGYWRDPARTAARFVPNPFAGQDESGTRLYRSGDLVAWREDGNLDFLGRIDQQIKLRGYRIELGEIETVLASQAGIQTAVVLQTEAGQGRSQLVGFLQAAAELDLAEVRSALQRQLPDYMVPARLWTLTHFPKTPNGKVDHRALLVWERDQSAPAGEPPRGEAERLMAGLWRETLGVTEIHRDDNFFQLGGDSILALQLGARAREHGLVLAPRTILANPTLAALAQLGREETIIPASQDLITGTAPLTPIQAWFFAQQFSEPHHWNMSTLLGLDASLEEVNLCAVLEQLWWHHDALRTRFVRHDGQWFQRFDAGATPLPFESHDLSQLDDEALSAAVVALCAEREASLQIEAGPLMRAVLMKAGPERPSRLLLAVHHLVVDAVSWSILTEDFQRLLQQRLAGQALGLPAKTSAYRDWAEVLQREAVSTTTEAERAWWQQRLHTATPALAVDGPGPNLGSSARALRKTLAAEESDQLLRALPALYGCSIEQVLLLALARSLAGGQGRLLLALEGHGRDLLDSQIDASRSVGWFTNMYPVLLDLEGCADTARSLWAVRDQLRQVPRKGLGYGLLRYLSPDPLVELRAPQLSFNYLGQGKVAGQEDEFFRSIPEQSELSASPKRERTYLLDISAQLLEGCLQLKWAYSEAVHERATVAAWAEACVAELRGMLREAGGDRLAQPQAVDAALAAQVSLVPLAEGGPLPPLFCVHPLGGTVSCYNDFADLLDPARPVYGLQARGLTPGQEPHTSVTEMAAWYVAALQTVQPSGPYYLFGWSAGGLIAYAMAQHLHGIGEEVVFLGNLDCGLQDYSVLVEDSDDGTRLAAILADKSGFQGEEAAWRDLPATERLAEVIRQAKNQGILQPNHGPDQLRPMLQTYDQTTRALAGYKASPYPGEMQLFYAETQTEQASLGEYLGWQNLTKITRTVVPGSHQKLLQPPSLKPVTEAVNRVLTRGGAIGQDCESKPKPNKQKE